MRLKTAPIRMHFKTFIIQNTLHWILYRTWNKKEGLDSLILIIHIFLLLFFFVLLLAKYEFTLNIIFSISHIDRTFCKFVNVFLLFFTYIYFFIWMHFERCLHPSSEPLYRNQLGPEFNSRYVSLHNGS